MYARGEHGEDIISAAIRSSGFQTHRLTPNYLEPPKIVLDGMPYTLPDYLSWTEDELFYDEMKTMHCASYHRNTGVWEVGIKKKHLDDYREVQRLTGIPVRVFVLLLCDGFTFPAEKARWISEGRTLEPEIRWLPLDELDDIKRVGMDVRTKKPDSFVFWAYDQMRTL